MSNDGGTISGTAEPGSTVTIRDGNVILGTSVADSVGNFTLTLTQPKLNGETLTANATDAAGNTGPATAAAAPDTTPPQTPVIVSVIDDVQATTGPVGQNGLTNDRAPTLNGTGEPGSTITISNGSDILGTVNVPHPACGALHRLYHCLTVPMCSRRQQQMLPVTRAANRTRGRLPLTAQHQMPR